MPISVLFWVLMLFWFFAGMWFHRGELKTGNYIFFGGNLLMFFLLALLGWRVFGPALQ